MGDCQKQKLGAVVIPMKKLTNLPVEVLLGGDLETIDCAPLPPYSKEAVDFLTELSKRLLKNPASRTYPDIAGFGYWIRKANLARLGRNFETENCRVGRGLVLHIAPRNVAVNFAFSLAFGLLSGNANIVRIPGVNHPQTTLICEEMGELLKEIKDRLPELPSEKKARFIDNFGLSEYDAENLTSQKAMADYYEIIIDKGADVKLSANWVMGELSASLNKNQIDIKDSPISAPELFNLISRITDNTISGKIAKDVFRLMWDEKRSVDEIIKDQGLEQMTDVGALESVIDEIIAKNLNQVEQFRNGNTKLLGFFVGQVMKATQGKANPKQVNQILNDRLS